MKLNKLLVISALMWSSNLHAAEIHEEDLVDLLDSHAIPVNKRRCPQGVPACTEEDLNAFELATGGRKIPDQLRWFMKRYSQVSFMCRGVILAQPHAREFYLREVHDAWDQGVPKDWLPFCNDNGDYHCINFDTGEVRFWSSDALDFTESTGDQWSSFYEWIVDDWAPLWDYAFVMSSKR